MQRHVVRLPDGSEGVREYIRHPGAVMILPLFEDGGVLLERQFRYPHGREFIELPAGKRDPGEQHVETVKRELLEETGYVAAEWRRLCLLHPSIAYSDEGSELWLPRLSPAIGKSICTARSGRMPCVRATTCSTSISGSDDQSLPALS